MSLKMPKKHRIQNRTRQRLLSDNHSTCTAFLMGYLSKYVTLEISYPNKLSTLTLVFPKLKNVIFEDKEIVDVYSIIGERIDYMRKTMTQESNKDATSSDKDSTKHPRLNFERRYEIFHYIIDLLKLYTPCEIYDLEEEHGGISGNYSIKINDQIYKKDVIDKKGVEMLKRLYKEKKGGRLRIKILWNDVSDIFV